MKHCLALQRQGWQIKHVQYVFSPSINSAFWIRPSCTAIEVDLSATCRYMSSINMSTKNLVCTSRQHLYGDNTASEILTHWVMPGRLTCDRIDKVFAPISTNTLCPSAVVHSLAFGQRNTDSALGCGSSDRRRLHASIQHFQILGIGNMLTC